MEVIKIDKIHISLSLQFNMSDVYCDKERYSEFINLPAIHSETKIPIGAITDYRINDDNTLDLNCIIWDRFKEYYKENTNVVIEYRVGLDYKHHPTAIVMY